MYPDSMQRDIQRKNLAKTVVPVCGLLLLSIAGCSSSQDKPVSSNAPPVDASATSAELCEQMSGPLSMEFNAVRDLKSGAITSDSYAALIEQSVDDTKAIEHGSASPVEQAIDALIRYAEVSDSDAHGAPYDYYDRERTKLTADLGQACMDAGTELVIYATSGG